MTANYSQQPIFAPYGVSDNRRPVFCAEPLYPGQMRAFYGPHTEVPRRKGVPIVEAHLGDFEVYGPITNDLAHRALFLIVYNTSCILHKFIV